MLCFTSDYDSYSYSRDDAISAQNLLNILLASTNIYGNTFNQNPFPSQFGQNSDQGSSATNLLTSISGIFRSNPAVVGNLKKTSYLARGGLQGQNYRKSFKIGKENLRNDKSLYKYVRRIRNPFTRQGKAIIKSKSVKKQITNRNRRIPCKRLAKNDKNALKVCQSIRKRKKSLRARKKKFSSQEKILNNQQTKQLKKKTNESIVQKLMNFLSSIA